MSKTRNKDAPAQRQVGRVCWSNWPDTSALELLGIRGMTALDYVNGSPYHAEFDAILRKVASNLSSKENLHVTLWYYPFVYIIVRHSDYKHYPCDIRFMVSFDLSNGLLHSEKSANRHGVVRRGWKKFSTALIGHALPQCGDCPDKTKTTFC